MVRRPLEVGGARRGEAELRVERVRVVRVQHPAEVTARAVLDHDPDEADPESPAAVRRQRVHGGAGGAAGAGGAYASAGWASARRSESARAKPTCPPSGA